MTKYTTEFKLKVVQFYLSGQGGQKRTAHVFSVNHSDVRKWVAMYQKYGQQGITAKTTYQRHSVSFKLKVVSSLLQDGLSLRDAALRFGISDSGSVSKWLHLYNKGGIEALTPKQRGRKAMKKPSVPPHKKDQHKTHEELLKELTYLRAENAYLKKLEALIQEDGVQQKRRESSKD